MHVSGFTFLRNGTLLGYPYLESLRSLLPLVDEVVVNVGRGEDDTLDRVRALARAEPRIRILETVWNERMEQKGFVYAQQKMIAQYACTGDWAFYLEGDEVLHEDDVPAIRAALERHHRDPRVEALAFDYLHFYGTPRQRAISPAWYRRELRVIRNTIRTYAPDGQYWVVMDHRRTGRYPRAALAGARIFHYGYCRSRSRMAEKSRQMGKYWGWGEGQKGGAYEYGRIDPRALAPYEGTHPAVVREWLATEAEHEFAIAPGYRPSSRERKHRVSMALEGLLGVDLSKRHFKLARGA
jgi:hypothetical protein